MQHNNFIPRHVIDQVSNFGDFVGAVAGLTAAIVAVSGGTAAIVAVLLAAGLVAKWAIIKVLAND